MMRQSVLSRIKLFNDTIAFNQEITYKEDSDGIDQLKYGLDGTVVGIMAMMMIRSGAKQQAIINKKLNKYIKNVKKYRVIWGGKDKRIFAIEKGVAPYKNKKTGKQKQMSGYWHYHLPNGGHYQPWYMAPSGYKIIK